MKANRQNRNVQALPQEKNKSCRHEKKLSIGKRIVLALGFSVKHDKKMRELQKQSNEKVNEYSGLTDKEECELWEKAHQDDIKEAIKEKNWSWLYKYGD